MNKSQLEESLNNALDRVALLEESIKVRRVNFDEVEEQRNDALNEVETLQNSLRLADQRVNNQVEIVMSMHNDCRTMADERKAAESQCVTLHDKLDVSNDQRSTAISSLELLISVHKHNAGLVAGITHIIDHLNNVDGVVHD